MTTTNTKLVKEKARIVNQLRYAEYYDMQDTFDALYEQSKEGSQFHKLMKIVKSRENILLAYRTIKRNKGSNTPGTDGKTIKDLEKIDQNKFVERIQNRLEFYHPSPVRRVMILKANGKKRPLGIPCIEDRVIQQCFKQVLEPICEAKFYPHSYGFRPNRSTEHAIHDLIYRINMSKCYYVVDFDIKGFFDNVDHGKLTRQIWSMGIRDKTFISIIKAILRAEINGEGIPEKGTPQGGILSPLLANIVLNELDWWISNQWENFRTYKTYKPQYNKNGVQDKASIYRRLRKTKLKEIYFVRYADDFKIICKKKKDAKAIYHATKDWLKERLNLDIIEEKSGIVDVRQSNTEFLGFKIKARKKSGKYVAMSHMTNKAMERTIKNLKTQLKVIQKYPNYIEVNKYNQMVAGAQDYYRLATHVNIDFNNINYQLLKCQKNRIKPLSSKAGYQTKDYKNRYKTKGATYNVAGLTLYPITDISCKNPMGFNQHKTNYTTDGRMLVHEDISHVDKSMLNYLMKNPIEYASIELNDNRLSLYSAQKGKCAITNAQLEITMNVHHIKPRHKGGSDRYKNLVLISYEAHKLIHATDEETIKLYLEIVKPDKLALDKLNQFRLKVGNSMIDNNI